MPKINRLYKFAMAVSKRCGISHATLEVAIPAVFDEIRQMLAEGDKQGFIIESFGTFVVKQMPAREYHYNNPKKGIDRIVPLPPKKIIKLSPARNLQREVDAGQFDPSRQSFVWNPDDPRPRYIAHMKYKKRKEGATIAKDGQMRYDKQ